mgnify:CR=1 FL=1
MVPVEIRSSGEQPSTSLEGNLTGTESLAPEVDAKRVELLKREIVPGLSAAGQSSADAPATSDRQSI